MMRFVRVFLILLCAVTIVQPPFANAKEKEVEYVVLASMSVKKDSSWNAVVEALQQKHRAKVLFYNRCPQETLEALKELRPRYVAIVEMPENLGQDYIIDMHKMSRNIDDDVYADFLWGVVTGYDANSAMKMLNNSTEPLVIHSAIATIAELSSGKWFDRFAWIDDQTSGLWGEKKFKGDSIRIGNKLKYDELLPKFTELYSEYNPDLVVTASHATERELLMPYSLGKIMAKNGQLLAYSFFSKKTWPLRDSGRRKVYFAVGNCLIGNVNNTKESMAIAWMNGGNAAIMIGYVVPTWHGRNGWGGLKYWLTTPGRYSLAEAIYLNQQDMLHQMNNWSPRMLKEDYPRFDDGERRESSRRLKEMLNMEPTRDQIGFWYDRDVLAFYGDPLWNVRLQEIPEENDFIVTSKMRGSQYVITIRTKDDFNIERMKGNGWKSEHVLDLPFSYFFPERLKSPRLAEGQAWDVALDENFLLIYNCDFAPGKTYEVVLDIDR